MKDNMWWFKNKNEEEKKTAINKKLYKEYMAIKDYEKLNRWFLHKCICLFFTCLLLTSVWKS